MSKTQAITYKGRSFWAFDAALAVWLGAFIDEAARLGLEREGGWEERLQDWRWVGTVGDIGIDLDELDTTRDMARFLQVAAAASRGLRALGTLPGQETVTRVLVDHPTRAARYGRVQSIDAEPIARLGDAMINLIDGTLPAAPARTWWLFGSADQGTISMRPEAEPG